MKTLILLRHAKSDWKSTSADDHERPLNQRGRRSAAQVGQFLKTMGQVPEQVVTSSAVRAKTTVELAAQAGSWACGIEVVKELYLPSASDVVGVLARQEDRWQRVLLAGHEPTWSHVVGQMTGGSSVKMVTAAMARIEFPVDRWADVPRVIGTLTWLITPKMINAAGTLSTP